MKQAPLQQMASRLGRDGQDSEGNQEHTEECVPHVFKNTKWVVLLLDSKLISSLCCSQDRA